METSSTDLPRSEIGMCIVGRNLWLPVVALMQIPKEWVDSFETGREIPSCQIRAEWTKPGKPKPSQLTYEVTLVGAKGPKNYFYIELDSTPPDTTGSEFMCWHKPFGVALGTSPFSRHF